MYYLQTRYYDPETGRFINADGLVSTPTGLLGGNMFAYCNNNPVMLSDPSGCYATLRRGSSGGDVSAMQNLLNGHGAGLAVDGKFGPLTRAAVKNYQRANGLKVDGICGQQTWGSLLKVTRNDTREISSAVLPYLRVAAEGRKLIAVFGYMGMPGALNMFYSWMNHGAIWDVKLKAVWESTIGTTFPGVGVKVQFDRMMATPEEIGNYMYGYIGAAFGFSLDTLYFGSYYAAGFPGGGPKLYNEFYDWGYIQKGYWAAFG